LEHKLNLDDYIDGFLPKEYVLQQNLRNKIKISDLASHQSGLPDIDFAKLIEMNPQQPVSNVTAQTLAEIINSCSELKDYGKPVFYHWIYFIGANIRKSIWQKL
jgi:CubicO group peptidase (beta-lactamase class C family)